MKKPIHPYWGLAEIATFSALYFTGLWFTGPLIGSSPLLQLLFWVLFLFGVYYILWYSPKKLHQFRFSDIGFVIPWRGRRFKKNLKNSWHYYAAFTIAGAIILIFYTSLFKPHTLSQLNWNAILIKFFGYLVYGTIQAVIFFGFMVPRLRRALFNTFTPDNRMSFQFSIVVLIAVIFSVFHFPNPQLMLVTFVAGLGWAWIFYSHPNILLMGLSHAILGTILHQVVKLHMRIGPFYNNPDLYVIREVVPGLKNLIGNLF